MEAREKAINTLQAISRISKGVHLSNNGCQIISDETHEIKCAICKYAAKVTMPLPRTHGVKPCEGNKHMSWVPFDHPTLGDVFKKRLATKKSMLQFEAEIYSGPSPARKKTLNGAKNTTSKERVETLKSKVKALQAQIKAEQVKEKAIKTAIATKKAKVSAKTNIEAKIKETTAV